MTKEEMKVYFLNRYGSGEINKSDIEMIWSEIQSVSKSSLCMCKIATYTKKILKYFNINWIKSSEVVKIIKMNK